MAFPPAIIFINSDLTNQVKFVLKSQLFIHEEMTGEEFDGYVTMDASYPQTIRAQGKRILVIRSDFRDYTNRTLADIAIFCKNGQAVIEKNNFGPPQLSLKITHLYIHKLLRYNDKII